MNLETGRAGTVPRPGALKPWLSVILPVYRGEEWLGRTLSSIAIGACSGIEIIVIDSSPDEKSMAIIRRFEERLQLRIIDPGTIDRCMPQMNLGVELARTGEVVYHSEAAAGFRIHGSSPTIVGSHNLEDFAEQQRRVVDKHIEAVPIERRARMRDLSDASISINAALAAGANGKPGAFFDAVRTIAAVGPISAARYLHRSRLTERVLPRLRAKLAGTL